MRRGLLGIQGDTWTKMFDSGATAEVTKCQPPQMRHWGLLVLSSKDSVNTRAADKGNGYM